MTRIVMNDLDTIERMKNAMSKTWWLPESATIIDRPELCYYIDDGRNRILRLDTSVNRTQELVDEFCDAIGKAPGTCCFYPHCHDDGLKNVLRDKGFSPGTRHEGRVLDVQAYSRKTPADIDVRLITTFEDMKAANDVRVDAFGADYQADDAALRRDLANCQRSDVLTRFFIACDTDTGEPLSQAGMSLYPDENFGFLFGGGTVKAGRNRGAYTALVSSRVAYARNQQIDFVGLFARESSSAPIVARQGFELCGEMTYWERPGNPYP